MRKVIIGKSFFTLADGVSDGLVSGLLKLSGYGFKIASPGLVLKTGSLSKILEAEGIRIDTSSCDEENGFNKVFAIIPEKDKNISRFEDPVQCIFTGSHGPVKNFGQAVNLILRQLRSASVSRNTKETEIEVRVALDGKGDSIINTGIGFFDHMLEQIARHASINLSVEAKGDLIVDEHHTVEDVGIAVGTAINNALGEKRGINRYGFYLPMDETIARCAIDMSGRQYLNFKCKFKREKVGEFPTELTLDFFRGIASGMNANVYLRCKGKNDHHKIEALFKAFARALGQACSIKDNFSFDIPSTKGLL